MGSGRDFHVGEFEDLTLGVRGDRTRSLRPARLRIEREGDDVPALEAGDGGDRGPNRRDGRVMGGQAWAREHEELHGTFAGEVEHVNEVARAQWAIHDDGHRANRVRGVLHGGAVVALEGSGGGATDELRAGVEVEGVVGAQLPVRGNAGQGHPLRVDNFHRPGGESVGRDVGGQAKFHDLAGGHRIHGVQHSGAQQLEVIEGVGGWTVLRRTWGRSGHLVHSARLASVTRATHRSPPSGSGVTGSPVR